MKKLLISSLIAVFALGSAMTVGVSGAEAAPKGNAWGYWSNPGNSAYGRSHNKNYELRWGNRSFENFADFETYIRNWLEMWRTRLESFDGTSSADLSVSTNAASSVGDTTATLNGTVTWDSADYADVWFEYGTRSNALTYHTSATRLDSESDATDFSSKVTGLKRDTTYYVRAVAKDDNGDKDYGSVRSFHTSSDTSGTDTEPTVYTGAPRTVEDTSASIRGTVDMNDFDNGVVFFVYGEDESSVRNVADDFESYDDIAVSAQDLRKVRVDADLDSNGSYEQTVTGLTPSTKHYFAIGVAYTNADGDPVIKLGDVRTFTTKEDGTTNTEVPNVNTLAVRNITDDAATLRGAADMHDFNNGIVFFVYGTDKNLVEDVASDYDTYAGIEEDGDNLHKVKVDSDLDGEESYAKTVTGLEGNTKYYVAIGVEYENDNGDQTLVVDEPVSFVTE